MVLTILVHIIKMSRCTFFLYSFFFQFYNRRLDVISKLRFDGSLAIFIVVAPQIKEEHNHNLWSINKLVDNNRLGWVCRFFLFVYCITIVFKKFNFIGILKRVLILNRNFIHCFNKITRFGIFKKWTVFKYWGRPKISSDFLTDFYDK